MTSPAESSPLPSATDLARWTLAAQHPMTREWSDDESRLARLAADHDFDLRLATDLELAEQRAGAMAVGPPAQDYLNRWIAVAPDLTALLSIRFWGGDPELRFVDASALTRPPRSGDLRALAAAAIQAFGAFEPGYLRLWSAEPTDAFDGTGRDQRFLAAPLAQLKDTTATSAVPPELSLRTTSTLERWDDAVAAYADVDRAHPQHIWHSALQGREDLTESIVAGTLFDVLVGGEWAGYVGATTDTNSSLGLLAYAVQELILAPAFRGRGYGAHLAALLARAVPEPDRVLIGTIHADNRGALEAATRAGRHDVGGWFQLPLAPPRPR